MKQFLPIPVFALAACTATPETPPPAELVAYEGGDTCDDRAIRRLVGLSLSEVDLDTLPELYRIITPDLSVTMDYLPERANLELDDDENVVRAHCG